MLRQFIVKVSVLDYFPLTKIILFSFNLYLILFNMAIDFDNFLNIYIYFL